jgi:hypothetical protein
MDSRKMNDPGYYGWYSSESRGMRRKAAEQPGAASGAAVTGAPVFEGLPAAGPPVPCACALRRRMGT